MRHLSFSLLGILLIMQQTCQPKEGPNEKALLNNTWELVSIEGEPVDTALKRPTLAFVTEGNKINGFAGCNRFFGSYSQNKDSLSFSGLGATKMFCEQSMELENNYMSRLEKVEHFVVSQKESLLTLLGEGKPLLEFRREGSSRDE